MRASIFERVVHSPDGSTVSLCAPEMTGANSSDFNMSKWGRTRLSNWVLSPSWAFGLVHDAGQAA